MSSLESYSNPNSDIVIHNGRQYRRNANGDCEIVTAEPADIIEPMEYQQFSASSPTSRQDQGGGVYLSSDQVFELISQLAADKNKPHALSDVQQGVPSQSEAVVERSNRLPRNTVRTVAKYALAGALLFPVPHIVANLATTQVVSVFQKPINLGQAFENLSSDISSKFGGEK